MKTQPSSAERAHGINAACQYLQSCKDRRNAEIDRAAAVAQLVGNMALAACIIIAVAILATVASL